MNLNFILGKIKKDIFMKYPLTLLFLYLATTLLIVYIKDIDNSFLYTFILALYISAPLAGKIEGISKYRDNKFKKISSFLLISNLIGLSFYLKEISVNEKLLTTFLLFISYLSFFFLIDDKAQNKIEHFLKVLETFINSIVFSIIMLMGLLFIIFTIEELFNVDFNSYIYPRTSIAVMGYFFILVFLSALQDNKKILYSKFLEFLISKVFAPLLSIYLIILYAYLIKILFSKSYPKNIVPYLTLFYGVSGSFFCYSARLLDKKYIQIFINFFYKTLIPLVIMSYFSIIPRIMQYNLTENRYFVLIVALWLSILIIIDLFFKEKFVKGFIISFLALSFISALGPLSAINLSKFLQKNKLKKLLKIPKDSINEENKKEIYEILYYFNKNHSLKDTKLTKEDSDPYSLMESLGYDYSYDTNNYDDTNFSWYNFGGSSKVYNIDDYNYFIPRMANKYNYKDFSIDFTSNNLIIISEKGFTKSIKVEDIALYLIKNHSNSSSEVNGQIIDNLEYRIKIAEINKEFVFIINDLNCSYKEKSKKIENIYFEGVCFIKDIKN